ncbi:hypothetical protein SDC9_142838 [bioreactor metagenome]|uniref:Uncharacterized protein n=1 Tax=bioreactor metagenome TaxID=1076179 RepID=A0A645E4G5_9ZZZZ
MHHSQVRGIDVEGVRSHLQGSNSLVFIDLVALDDALQHTLIILPIWVLLESSFSSHLWIGIEIALQFSIGKHHRGDVPSFNHNIHILGNYLELLIHMASQRSIGRYLSHHLVNLRCMEHILNILAINLDMAI